MTGPVCLDRSPPLRTDALMPCSPLCLWTLWAGQGVWAFSASMPWSCPRRGVDQPFLGMGGFNCPCLPHLPGIVLDPTRILASTLRPHLSLPIPSLGFEALQSCPQPMPVPSCLGSRRLREAPPPRCCGCPWPLRRRSCPVWALRVLPWVAAASSAPKGLQLQSSAVRCPQEGSGSLCGCYMSSRSSS